MHSYFTILEEKNVDNLSSKFQLTDLTRRKSYDIFSSFMSPDYGAHFDCANFQYKSVKL